MGHNSSTPNKRWIYKTQGHNPPKSQEAENNFNKNNISPSKRKK